MVPLEEMAEMALLDPKARQVSLASLDLRVNLENKENLEQKEMQELSLFLKVPLVHQASRDPRVKLACRDQEVKNVLQEYLLLRLEESRTLNGVMRLVVLEQLDSTLEGLGHLLQLPEEEDQITCACLMIQNIQPTDLEYKVLSTCMEWSMKVHH